MILHLYENHLDQAKIQIEREPRPLPTLELNPEVTDVFDFTYDDMALKDYKPQDWNELVVMVKGGVARATCNGELLTDELAVPGSGPIGLEGDRGQMEYRRIRWKKLP